ncbi:hypothetical protein ACKKBF_B40515 [Auxenochlorella protothecoides x Auxenochlorella symbiontica]
MPLAIANEWFWRPHAGSRRGMVRRRLISSGTAASTRASSRVGAEPCRC